MRGITIIDLRMVITVTLACCVIQSCTSAGEKVSVKAVKNANGRNDAWGFTGIGGGGAMFHPSVSPYKNDVAFINCDMGGGYVTYDAGKTWRMFNLHGQVQFYVFDPIDPQTIYANTIGLFKSTDMGNTWRLVYPDPSEIEGLVSKGDHAEEQWVTRDSSFRRVLAMAIDPADSKKLFACIDIDGADALFTSSDGGAKWEKIRDLEDGARQICIDPFSPEDNRTLYVVGKNTVTRRKMSAWKTNAGPEAGAAFSGISGGADGQQKEYILYVISRKGGEPNASTSLFATRDGGLTWETRNEGLLAMEKKNASLPECRAISASVSHPSVVYLSYHNFQAGADSTFSGVAKSEDYRKTWKLVWKDVFTKNGSTPSPNFSRDWLNDRFGPGWGENPLGLGASPTDPAVCYATDMGRTVKTEDGGQTWQQVYSHYRKDSGWSSTGLEVTTGYTIAFDPFDHKHAFMANTDIGLLESRDSLMSWNGLTPKNGIPRSWGNTCYWIIFDTAVKGRAWATMSGTHDLPRPKMFRHTSVSTYKGGVLITNDGGATWKPVSSDIGEAAMTHIVLDPKSAREARTLYACAFGKGVYKSTDGGNHWQQKNNGLPATEPFAWQITRRNNDGVLFLILSRRSEDGSIGNDQDGALYRSDDGAEHWTKMSLPEGVNGPTSLLAGEGDPGKLVLSCWGKMNRRKFAPDTGGGIYVSVDEGENWKPVLEKDQHISDLTFDTRNNRFYACGFNGTAYYSEDGANTWTPIKGYNFKWGKRVEPDPSDPEKVFIITFGGGVWHGPATGDKNAIEDILTPISRK